MKLLKKIGAAALALCMLLPLAACGDGGGENGSVQGKVRFLVPMANVDVAALETIANSYMDQNPNVSVNIVANNGTGYQELISAAANSPGTDEITIGRVSSVGNYYGTSRLVDLRDYLEEPNEYCESASSYDGTWKSIFTDEAYSIETIGNTVPAINYEANYTVCFYDRRAMKDVMGTPDYQPETWDEMLDLLEKAKQTGYQTPLGLDMSAESCTGIFLGWLIKMYADQYFRDFVDEVHSREGDYSYISADADWKFSLTDERVDISTEYSSNLNLVVDQFFNNGKNIQSARFEDMMANLQELCSYSNPDTMVKESSAVGALDETTNYWNKELGIDSSAIGHDLAQKNVFLRPARLDSVLDYITRYALDDVKNNNGDVGAIINDRFGWFNLPAMTANDPDNAAAAPASTMLRSIGGPANDIGIINNGNPAHVRAAVDFLKYLMSPTGQNIRYQTYKTKGFVAVMPSMIKNVTVPESIDLTLNRTYVSGCDRNPINGFTVGYVDGNITSAGGGTALTTTQAGIYYAQYLSGKNDWDKTASSLQTMMSNSFANWAEFRKLKYSDSSAAAIRAAVGENMKTDPKKTQQ